jgi:hypothetical protein
MDIIKNIEPSVETASIDVLTKALDSRVTDQISAYRKLYALCL